MNETLNESMTRVSQSRIALWAAVVALLSLVSAACINDAVDETAAEVADVEVAASAGVAEVADQKAKADPADGSVHGATGESFAAACPLAVFPVRGRHETGYQASPNTGDQSIWTCNAANSNSDFFRRGTCEGHLGNDIWAREGTPVVAAVSGQIVQAELSAYSGNQVRIMDACGWSHYAIHLQAIAPGIAVGNHIEAGTRIGWVGKTGTASNGVVHLHYSIYPGEDYCQGVNPWPFLHAVEQNVCDAPEPDPCAVRDGKLFCGNRAAAPIRAAKSPTAEQINTLRTTYSWFTCFGIGEPHHGGNTTWYFTQGDDNPRWGWVAAGDLFTSSEFDAHPEAHGLPRCPP